MSEPLTDEQLAAIAAADAARTPGSWFYDQMQEKVFHNTESFEAIGIVCDVGSWNQTDADGFFVAVASWAVPALLAEVERLKAARDALRKYLDKRIKALFDAEGEALANKDSEVAYHLETKRHALEDIVEFMEGRETFEGES